MMKAEVFEFFLSKKVCQAKVAIGMVLIGIVLIATPLIVRDVPLGNSDQYFVIVNGEPVPHNTVAVLAQRLDGKPLEELSETRRESLRRLLIDEELLFQRAEALGLLSGDTTVRKALIRAAVDQLVAEYRRDISESKLRAYFNDHQHAFQSPLRLNVESMRFVDERQALMAYRELQEIDSTSSEIFRQVGKKYGASRVFEVSRAALPLNQIRQYLGPRLTDAAIALPEGTISEPVYHNQGYSLLHMVSRIEPVVPEFEQVRALVTREYHRRDRERALNLGVAALKAEANIALNLPDDVLNLIQRQAADLQVADVQMTYAEEVR